MGDLARNLGQTVFVIFLTGPVKVWLDVKRGHTSLAELQSDMEDERSWLHKKMGVDERPGLFPESNRPRKRQKENATNAMALRKRLGNTNKSIEEINKLSLEHPNPRFQLALLTQLFGDDAFLQQFQITGNKIRLRGRSQDAAKLMKTLSDEEAYLSVSAPQAITRLGNSGMEQFYIDIEVAQDLRR